MTTPKPDLSALGAAAAELMHDMRGLLALVDARMSLVLGEMQAGRLAPAEMQLALREHRELSAMTNDVVEVLNGRLEAGDMPIRPVGVVQTEIERALLGAPPVEVQLSSSLPDDTAIAGRASFLHRAVGNLLRNALRHARSKVHVAIQDEDRWGRRGIQIAIEDDGPGVPEGLRRGLFTHGSHGNHGGSGLGLSSVAWAVDELRGEVSYADGAEFGGARFQIWLPTGRTSGVPPIPVEGDEPLTDRCLVLIDDDPAILRVFTRLLSHVGARVLPIVPNAVSDEVWLDAIGRARPDAILLDLDLGVQNGVEVWEALNRQIPELAERVVFVSGAVGEGMSSAAGRTGQPVIAKPLDLSEVARVIRGIRPAEER